MDDDGRCLNSCITAPMSLLIPHIFIQKTGSLTLIAVIKLQEEDQEDWKIDLQLCCMGSCFALNKISLSLGRIKKRIGRKNHKGFLMIQMIYNGLV